MAELSPARGRARGVDRPALFWGLVLGLAAAAAWWRVSGRSLADLEHRMHSVNPVSIAVVALVVLAALVGHLVRRSTR